MRRAIVLLTAGFALLLAAACAQTADFVIVNDSTKPVKVVYKVRSEPSGSGYSPKIIDVSELSGNRWQALAPRDYLIDLQARTITIELPANKALRLIGIGNYAGHEQPDAAFAIQEITFSGANGEIVLSDEAARQAFVREANGNYYLHYK